MEYLNPLTLMTFPLYLALLRCVRDSNWLKSLIAASPWGVGGISSEILLGQWHLAGATPHHAKPILCLRLEIWALHQVLLTSMQHGFQSRPPVKNGLDAVCTDVVRWLHTSDLGFPKLWLGSRGGPHVKNLSSFFSHDWSNRDFR